MATVTAIYRPFLVAVRNTRWGVRLYECLTKVTFVTKQNKIDASGVKRLIPCMSFCS